MDIAPEHFSKKIMAIDNRELADLLNL